MLIDTFELPRGKPHICIYKRPKTDGWRAFVYTAGRAGVRVAITRGKRNMGPAKWGRIKMLCGAHSC